MADLVECISEDWRAGPYYMMTIPGPLPKIGQRYEVIKVIPCDCDKHEHFFYVLAGCHPGVAFWYENFRPVDERKLSTDTGFAILLDAAQKVTLPAKAPEKIIEEVSQLTEAQWQYLLKWASK